VGLRSFTHVSYLLTAASVNAGKVMKRTALCHLFSSKGGINSLDSIRYRLAAAINGKVGRTWEACWSHS
jgi:hypothetical protein